MVPQASQNTCWDLGATLGLDANTAAYAYLALSILSFGLTGAHAKKFIIWDLM